MFKPAVRICAAGLVAATVLAFGAAAPAIGASGDAVGKSAIVTSVKSLKVTDFIGKLYVPRYGKAYVRIIQEGTTPAVLNGVGLGHYIGTQLPGQEGNFAIAGHRAANGGPMLKIDKLRDGDLAFVKTKTDWYTYQWMATKVVKPSDVSVVYPVPKELPGAAPGGAYMAFTSCTPVHVNTNRIVAWFELVGEQPLSDGPPQEYLDRYSN